MMRYKKTVFCAGVLLACTAFGGFGKQTDAECARCGQEMDSDCANAVTDSDMEVLRRYGAVLDTLGQNTVGPDRVEYFLFDITGDGTPELWLSRGTYEAGKTLKAYTLSQGAPLEIYEGDGGHSDYLVYEGELVQVLCNCGDGEIKTFTYKEGRADDHDTVEFSCWNRKHKSLSKSKAANRKLEYWERNSDNYINLKSLPYPLK